jgi:hypothetical protein
MYVFAKLMLVVSSLLASAPLFASTSYVEALHCHSRFVSDLGEVNAALLCRGVESSNATAVNNCVSEAKVRTDDGKVIAILCQGIDYRITTATLNCFDQSVESMPALDAAILCQRTDYRAYTAKMNCLSAAKDSMSNEAGTKLCGGIAN